MITVTLFDNDTLHIEGDGWGWNKHNDPNISNFMILARKYKNNEFIHNSWANDIPYIISEIVRQRPSLLWSFI